jgi:hypothetical protein
MRGSNIRKRFIIIMNALCLKRGWLCHRVLCGKRYVSFGSNLSDWFRWNIGTHRDMSIT